MTSAASVWTNTINVNYIHPSQHLPLHILPASEGSDTACLGAVGGKLEKKNNIGEPIRTGTYKVSDEGHGDLHLDVGA